MSIQEPYKSTLAFLYSWLIAIVVTSLVKLDALFFVGAGALLP